jgi:nucleoside-diphosphate-sugar epimerase
MIGINLSQRLAREGHTLFHVCRPSADKRRTSWLEHTGRLLHGDVTDATSVRAAVDTAQADTVFHLASTAFHAPLPAEEHFRVIVGGTLNVLEALKDSPVRRIVVAGSAAEYGSGSTLREDHPLNPSTILGAAKASASVLVQTFSRLYGIPSTILRLFTPYGPWESPKRLIPHTILSALKGHDVSMTAGYQQRDFIYVDDVVDALMLAANPAVTSGAAFNIGAGTGIAVRTVVEQILGMLGNPVKALFGAVPTRSDEIMEMSADTMLARHELGWEPKTPLSDGLRRSIDWIKETGEYS